MNKDKKRGLRAKMNLYEDYCGNDIIFEPKIEILESHTDKNGITVIDKIKLISVDLCKKENKND